MKITLYRLLKIALIPTVALLGIFWGTSFVLGDDLPTPSIDVGGPELKIDNQTDYTIMVNNITFRDPISGNIHGFDAQSVSPRSKWKLNYTGQIASGFSGTTHDAVFYWGTPGKVNGGLSIYSKNGEWKNGSNNGILVVTLEKGKGTYETKTFHVDLGCSIANPTWIGDTCVCIKILWTVTWAKDGNNGWVITLNQDTKDMGCL